MKRKAKVTGKRKAGKKSINLKASAGERRRWHSSAAEFGEMYKPIKKPVTLRLDADVLAWFKKQGRGYQTRINRALRKVVEDAGK
ncbi:MAG TPA: BrnA antitoxin family protein [Terriglobales bacterium]|jgi:uncharacterized protein (DUF4415 family)